METEGRIAPETEAAAREEYAALADPAETVTREVARALDVTGQLQDRGDDGGTDDRSAGAVVGTAHGALFASLLVVYRGTTGEFDSWAADSGLDPDLIGSENVDRVAWHPVPFAGVVAAATFQDEPEAAVATLRRRAFGEYYRPVVRGGTEPATGTGARSDGDGPTGGGGGA